MIPRPSLRFSVLAVLVSLVPGLLAAANIGYTGNQPPDSAVILPVPADYLALEVRIRCDEEDWTVRLDSISAARQALAAAVASAGFELDANRPFSFKETYGGKGSGSSFSFFSYSSEASIQPGSVSRILVPLTPKTETLAVIRKTKALVDGLKVSKKTSVTLGDIRLGLKDPETRRAPLLEAIGKHVARTQAAMNIPERAVANLDGPLVLSQLDEYTVGIFLPFETSYSTSGSKR